MFQVLSEFIILNHVAHILYDTQIFPSVDLIFRHLQVLKFIK